MTPASTWLFSKCSFCVSPLELAQREVIDLENANLRARRDCSRLRRESSATLRTAAALRAAASNPARRRVVEPPTTWFETLRSNEVTPRDAASRGTYSSLI